VAKSAAESGDNGRRKERCCKSGGISGNFGGAGSDLEPLGAVRYETCFIINVENRRDGCIISAVFEAQKEIPDIYIKDVYPIVIGVFCQPILCHQQGLSASPLVP
jgi:hypothetical protein